jgi:hypothetical protein
VTEPYTAKGICRVLRYNRRERGSYVNKMFCFDQVVFIIRASLIKNNRNQLKNPKLKIFFIK